MSKSDISEIFERVMRSPSSQRGLDVEATCGMLAEEVKKRFSEQEFEETIKAVEEYYINQFTYTIASLPGFGQRIQREMERWKR